MSETIRRSGRRPRLPERGPPGVDPWVDAVLADLGRDANVRPAHDRALSGSGIRAEVVAVGLHGGRFVKGREREEAQALWVAASHDAPRFRMPFDYPGRVALSADGGIVAAGTSTGGVCVWRVADRTLLAAFQGHPSGILGVALSDDGGLVADGGYDGIVRVWEVSTGRLVLSADGHDGPVYSVALTAGGRCVASGSTDQQGGSGSSRVAGWRQRWQDTRAEYAAWP